MDQENQEIPNQQTTPQVPPTYNPNPSKTKMSKGLIIGLICSTLLCVIAFILVTIFVLNKNSVSQSDYHETNTSIKVLHDESKQLTTDVIDLLNSGKSPKAKELQTSISNRVSKMNKLKNKIKNQVAIKNDPKLNKLYKKFEKMDKYYSKDIDLLGKSYYLAIQTIEKCNSSFAGNLDNFQTDCIDKFNGVNLTHFAYFSNLIAITEHFYSSIAENRRAYDLLPENDTAGREKANSAITNIYSVYSKSSTELFDKIDKEIKSRSSQNFLNDLYFEVSLLDKSGK